MDEADRGIPALVRAIVAGLVDDPEQITIKETSTGDNLLIEVSVAPNDVGKVIGRHGRVVKSIRALARAAATLRGPAHVDVEIVN
ncbi:MAG: KH domain-containing protein [Actinomycetia bacterium]|nr:KH domain-containing protein [Actinomycetes bacterium]